MMAAPPPVLSLVDVDDLVEEILLRVPPDKPAFLVSAAHVSKQGHRIVSDPGFRRRLGLFHRTPPMLGFFYQDASTARFTPTTSFRYRLPVFDDCYSRRNWRVLDARHGRALFDDNDNFRNRYQSSSATRTVVVDHVVSSPITGDSRRLPVLRFPDCQCSYWNAGLLCAAAGCEHWDCPSSGAFTVVLVGMFEQNMNMMALVYSSELHKWIATTSHIKQHIYLEDQHSSSLVGDAICFLSFDTQGTTGILRYDLGKEELSFISLLHAELPRVDGRAYDGGGRWARVCHDAGFVYLHVARGSSGSSSTGWTKHKAIELKSLLLVPDSAPSRIISHVDGTGVLFVSVAGVGVFTINLKSRRVSKVFDAGDIRHVIPYLSFCTPIG